VAKVLLYFLPGVATAAGNEELVMPRVSDD